MLLLFSIPAHAAFIDVYYENYAVSDGQLQIYANVGDFVPALTEKDFEVTLNGDILPIASLGTVEDSGGGISYMLLADVSGSMTKTNMESMRNVLYGIIDSLTDNDNAAIMKIGNEPDSTSFLSDKAALTGVVDGLKSNGEDTNLYKGIVSAIKTLRSDTSVNTKRCLVVISDGKDDFNAAGYTLADAEKAIIDAHIPLYTIIVPGKDADAAKTFAGLSRISAGGIEQILNGITPEDAAKNILSFINNSYIITCDLTGVDPLQEQSQLEIKVTASGLTGTDSVIVSSAEIRTSATPKPSAEAVSPSPESAETDNIDSESNDPSDSSLFSAYKQWIIIGIAALIVIIAVIILLQSRKKRSRAVIQLGNSNRTVGVTVVADSSHRENVSPTVGVSAPANVQSKEIVFVKLGNDSKQYSFTDKDELTIGRADSNTFAIPDNVQLSSVHCRIYLSGEQLCVEDLNSTNGTYLNGSKVLRPMPLELNDILLLGSLELRVSW
jgi:hypothetical protein